MARIILFDKHHRAQGWGRGCFRAFVYHECPTLPSALPPEAVEAVDAASSHTAARLCARLALDD